MVSATVKRLNGKSKSLKRKEWGGKHRNCLPEQGAPKHNQVRSAAVVSKELPGCPSNVKGLVCAFTQEKHHRKGCEGGAEEVLQAQPH